MSTRIHQKNVHENLPQKRNSHGQQYPREFTHFVHENSPFMSTRILPPLFHPFCPRKFHFMSTRILLPRLVLSGYLGLLFTESICRGDINLKSAVICENNFDQKTNYFRIGKNKHCVCVSTNVYIAR